jgi:hypothetical protein
LLSQWQQALQAGGFAMPTSVNVPVTGTNAIADALYKSARTVVFLNPVSDDIIGHLRDQGRAVLVMPDPAQWPAQFAANPHVFGLSQTLT